MLIKRDGKYVLMSKDGSKKLGAYSNKKVALSREKQIQFFKALEKRKNKDGKPS